MSLQINNLTGFGGTGVADIILTDEGTSSPDSGAGGTAHTYNSKASTRAHAYVLITWEDAGGTANTLSTITWNTVGMTIEKQQAAAVGGDKTGAAICYIPGVQAAQNIVATFSAGTKNSKIDIISIDNLRSSTYIDVDSASGSGSTGSLAALVAPSAGGISLAIIAHEDSPTTIGWTPSPEVVELSDADLGGTARHSSAYRYGVGTGDINWTSTGGAARFAICGISLR